jgi:preprotein translocase subunit SecA
MQDELMRLFGPERFAFLLNNWEESEPIEARLISRQIEAAQKKVEGHNFEIRQHVLKYDDVMNRQREVIYVQRRQVLEGQDIRESVIEAINKAVRIRVDEYTSETVAPASWDLNNLSRALVEICPVLPLYYSPEEMRYGPSNPLFEAQHRAKIWQNFQESLSSFTRPDDLYDDVLDHIMEAYEQREQDIGEENMRMLERLVTLRIIDGRWISHLDEMDFLREGIGLRGYAQIDPLVAYTNESFELWNRLISDIQDDIGRNILRVQLISEEEQHKRSVYRPTATNRSDEGPSKGDRVSNSGVGRNAPCPCGSGKKYKNCCMLKKEGVA